MDDHTSLNINGTSQAFFQGKGNPSGTKEGYFKIYRNGALGLFILYTGFHIGEIMLDPQSQASTMHLPPLDKRMAIDAPA